MSDAELFRHLMDHLFSFYYGKIGLCLECDETGPFVAKGALTQSLFEMIAKAIFVLNTILVVPWMSYLASCRNRMLSSPE
ncbi:hypothetical protein NPIL_297491, partial [Nephila pilipes]